MNYFRLYFKNIDNQYFSLKFKCYNTPISIKWFNSLSMQYYKNKFIKETDRLYNFLNSESEEELIQGINECISIINHESLLISDKAFLNMNQHHLNLLHVYFEKLRNDTNVENNFWKNATNKQKKALETYNVLIHKTENFYRNKNSNVLNPRIVCTFNNRTKYLLDNNDYNYFTLVRNFGEVYINYCEVGKPLYDVFKDNDKLVGDNNIKPLKWYSPDFFVTFHERNQENVDTFLNKMDKWWDKNKDYLNNLGFVKNNKKNAIGNIPVAKLVTTMKKETVLKKINNYYCLSHIKII